MRLRYLASTATAFLTGAALIVAGTAGTAAPSPAAAATLRPAVAGSPRLQLGRLSSPPTTAGCEADYGIACYSPRQLQTAYGTTALYARHVTGHGTTIAVVDAFGSPTIRHDLHAFDHAFGLPDPALSIIAPAGKLPRFDPSNDDMSGWAWETTLDVEYAHALAPGARILLVLTPVSETEGVHGVPQIVQAENYVLQHHLADVISQSFGATENTFASRSALLAQRSAFVAAVKHHVTVLAASGDNGATDDRLDGSKTYPYRVDSWPSTDPLVTSVGGTHLFLDAQGRRTSPDTVWNDGMGGAGGGGVSKYFARPAYQNSVAGVVGSRRGTPDVAMSASTDGGAVVYGTFDPDDAGWTVFGGTSEATPLFAGIVALADQLAGHSLGQLNPAIYALARRTPSGLVDVTSGNNSAHGVKGYSAAPGYDLASGLGTVDAAVFVPALVALVRHTR